MKKGTTLWIEIDNKNVTLATGAKPPEPDTSRYLFIFGQSPTIKREEFERWAQVKLPKKPGIYGLEITSSVISKVRVVTEKKFVAAEHTTKTAVVEPLSE